MGENGALVIGMTGKNCFALAADRRLGSGMQTVSTDFQKIFEIGPHLYTAFPGLATDTITVAQKLKFRVNLYELRENRKIRPKTLNAIVSNMFYEKRFGPFYVEGVIAGLDPKTFEPFLSSMDCIGAENVSKDFLVAGSGTTQAFGVCEAIYKPDMEPDDLFETISQAIISASERDPASGWGFIVYVVEKDKVTTKTLKSRMD